MRNISSCCLTMKELEIGKTKGTSYIKTFNFVYWRPLVFPISYSYHGQKTGLKLKGGKHAVLTVQVSFRLCSLFSVHSLQNVQMFNPKYDLCVCNPTFYMVKIVHEIFYTATRPYSKGLIEKMSLDRKCMVTNISSIVEF